MVVLRILAVSESGETVEREFDVESLTVGRSTTAGLSLADRFLSREHARLYRDGDSVMIEDLDSRNGTNVNGERIGEPTAIGPGDTIGLSSFTLTIHAGSEPMPGDAGVPDHQHPAGADLGATVLIPASELLSAKPILDEAALGSLEKRREEIDLYLERLELLDEVHRSLAASISHEELLDLILDRVFEHLKPEQGAILLGRPDGSFETVARRSAAGAGDEVFYSETLVAEVAGKCQGALVLDAQTDERFADAASILDSGVRSIVAAPLAVDDEGLGLIAMSSRLSVRQFEERDLELLVALASVAALRLRNLALAVEAAEKRKLEAEVALARTIQEELLPTELPEIRGYEVRALNRPSQGVSGDLYQVIETESSGDFYLILYDVSGKGLAASLLAATIEALTAGPAVANHPPDRVCTLVNRQLEERTSADRFATAFLAQLSAASGELAYTSAGHNPALLIRGSGEIEQLKRTGVPLGVVEQGKYELERRILGPGDLLVVYTDGLTEACDPAGEEYGLDRLADSCGAHRSLPIPELAEAIESDVAEFAAGTPYGDDRTLMLLRRTD